MSNINVGRVVLGGVVAGVIIDVIDFVLNGVILADQWENVTAAMNLPAIGTTQIIWINVFGLLLGIVAVWTYAAIRPRFGAGPKTAVFAALLTWVTAGFICVAYPTIMSMFPMTMAVTMVGVGLVEIIAATLAGAWLYKE